MRKILSLRGDALAATMKAKSVTGSRTRDGYGSDKRDYFPVVHTPTVFAAVSEYRQKTGIPYRKQPIGARQPQWSYDPESATAREERVAMLADGSIGQSWKQYKAPTARLDKAKHAKTLARIAREASATVKVRREI